MQTVYARRAINGMDTPATFDRDFGLRRDQSFYQSRFSVCAYCRLVEKCARAQFLLSLSCCYLLRFIACADDLKPAENFGDGEQARITRGDEGLRRVNS